MDENIGKEILDELFSSLETIERQNAALWELLKSKGIVSDEELAPHLEEARGASSVRWLAARVRIDHLIAGATKADQRKAEAVSAKAPEKSSGADSAAAGAEQPKKSQPEQSEVDAGKTADKPAPEAKAGDASISKDQDQSADAGNHASDSAPENAA